MGAAVLRAFRFLAWCVAATAALALVALVAYDLLAFQPYRQDIQTLVDRASATEKAPPAALLGVLSLDTSSQRAMNVARQLHVRFFARQTRLRRMFSELLWTGLLRLHFSGHEITGLRLSMAYMGPGTTGFEAAAPKLLGCALADVNPLQAATLFAVARVPTTLDGDPERLAARAARILERVQQSP